MQFLFGVLGLTLVALALQFNGLYGQDAHEYLRQSLAFRSVLSGHFFNITEQGSLDFAPGYPFLGALFQVFNLPAIFSLQAISILAAGISLLLLERLLIVLSPGTTRLSRLAFIGLLCLGAPLFIRAGICSMSDSLGLALALAALLSGLKSLEIRSIREILYFAFFTSAAISVRYAMAALLLPLVIVFLLLMVQKKQWLSVLASGMIGISVFMVFSVLKNGVGLNLFQHSLVSQWSLLNLFKASFENINGHISYLVINLLYIIFYPILHPGFCILLPGLLLLFKKTDIHLPAKKILAACLLCYLLLLGGIAHQNLRYLLPAYTLWLLLLFPAWDRFFAYGGYFFKKTTYGVLLAVFFCQIAGAVWFIKPIIARNHLEINTANTLKMTLKSDDTLYAFDLDIALKTYLPELKHVNLWSNRYDSFEIGAYILFNEQRLAAQWAGKNPMLNWEHLQEHYVLHPVLTLQDGWVLYKIRNE